MFQAPEFTPPGARKVSPRELLAFLQNPDQVGYPGTVNTDACFGFSLMAYQSPEILSDIVEARHSALVRLMGPVSKGHDSPKSSPAQRGEVGSCPYCVSCTHVAIPGTFTLGPYDALKHTGLRLWAESGPWAPRRLAAIDYVLSYNGHMPLPTGWDWAANSLESAPPLVLVCGAPRRAPLPIPTVTEAGAGLPKDRDPEPKQQEEGPKLPAIGGALRLDSLLPGAGPAQSAHSTRGADDVSSAAPKSKSELAKGKGVNACRGGHWRGMRKPKPQNDTTSAGNYTGSPSAPYSWSSYWIEWKEWRE